MVKHTQKSLGELLLENGLITSEQLELAQQAVTSSQSFQDVLIESGLIGETDLVDFIAHYMDVPRIELSNCAIDPEIVHLIPESLARKYQIIPVLKIANNLTCAMVDIFNIYALDEVALHTDLVIEPAIATREEIKKALDEHYSMHGNFDRAADPQTAIPATPKKAMEKEVHGAEAESGEDTPMIKIVNTIIQRAIAKDASDIHLEPGDGNMTVRYRIDGLLYKEETIPKHLQSAVLSRIKVLSNMDIAERRKPQDGRFQMLVGKKQIDIRVSCVPSIHGENIVLRLLGAEKKLIELNELGFEKQTLQTYKKILHRNNGILLVTGPTGSGKTTTLYASLNLINASDKNIITIEDPVEYRFPGACQIQVNPSVDLTFATGLRSILRQDPDIIMVGEIRDLETAKIAIQAALTGHMVLATLHTNDASGAIPRLIDMGIEPFLIASSLMAVLDQRLVRRICPSCSGKGCSACNNVGYKGRIGIYELMVTDENIRTLTVQKSSLDLIRKAALETGMLSLREDGMQKVQQGITTEEEVFRVVPEE